MIGINTQLMKLATYYKNCNILISLDQAMLNSTIDYGTCLLVNKLCEILQDIIEGHHKRI